MEALLLAAGAALLLVLNQRSRVPAPVPAPAPAPTPTPAPAPAPPVDPRAGGPPAADSAWHFGLLSGDLWWRWERVFAATHGLGSAPTSTYYPWPAGNDQFIQFAGAPASSAPPAPIAYHSSYPFQARTRAGRSGDSYDSAWGSVPVLRTPGSEGNGLGVQGNVLMRVAWWSQLWLTGPSITGPEVSGVPYSGTYFPVQGGGYVRMSDLSVAPS